MTSTSNSKINFFANLSDNVRLALTEDIGSGDLTADLIPEAQQAHAKVICRENAIICGRPWFDEVCAQVDSTLQVTWHCEEGEMVEQDALVCEITGNAASILTAERSALNFLQTLSATASATQKYVAAMQGSNTKLLDTRKTLPGLRLAQKYAVSCGGGNNHRIGLYDAILIKENHIMAAGGIQQAVSHAKQKHSAITVEVETENLDELQQALAAQADIIMLDNYSIEMIEQAIVLNQQHEHTAKLEISGDVTLETLPELAKTGVDFISTGAITKHIKATDFSMRFQFK